MDQIDYIHYIATTTGPQGTLAEVTEAYIYMPFLDFFVVFLVLLFSLLAVKFIYKVLYIPRFLPVEIRNYLQIAKKSIKSIFD